MMNNSDQAVHQLAASLMSVAPAYPFDQRDDAGDLLEQHAGLTKREYMATAIMAGMCTNGFMPAMTGLTGVTDPVAADRFNYAKGAVILADALLLELAK